jgi:hypothetical protein
MGAPGRDHLERQMVIVAANVTLGHKPSESMRRPVRRARKVASCAARRQPSLFSAAGAASLGEAPAQTAG